MGRAWVKARKHDRFYKAAKRQEYRSRAAIKLSQIDLRYGLLRSGDVVVDLGAAPGGWSQVARERVGPKGRVIAVDLVPIIPLDGVETLRGDITLPEVQARLFELLRRPAHVVISDMSPKISGNHALDTARSIALADAVLTFGVRALKPNGTLLVKVFQGDGYPAFLRRLRDHFAAVKGIKPSSSSPRSSEIYVLAVDRL